MALTRIEFGKSPLGNYVVKGVTDNMGKFVMNSADLTEIWDALVQLFPLDTETIYGDKHCKDTPTA